ncbi:MAG: molybdopterin-dependent oxidoreductase [[Actinobacillus] rossii]|nr:molybdopterin-dependent oxidoreductase [[Actinobacillus] rossii]MDY5793968.1 selenate/tellurate reductase subunit YnfF [[Actinobacillus] rossii]
MENTNNSLSLSRRGFLKGSSLGVAALATDIALPFNAMATEQIPVKNTMQDNCVWSACTVNCGSRCALRLHVKNDEVYWVETDNTGNDEYGNHQVRACLRGRSIRRRMNHPDRLKYPMKRVGKRGEGKFKRITWEEALDTIADNLKRILKDYGNEAVHVLYGTGVDGGNITNSNVPYRLMNSCGGFLSRYGNYSAAQISMAMQYLYGERSGNSPDDIANSKLVVMFGNNPAETRMSGGGVTYYVEQARERSNARMILIDPRYNDTGVGREDEWIPIRPGTDGALAAALAYVLITEDMVDQAFLDKYCVGYDEKTLPASAPKNSHYKAYILGQGDDGIAKTPEWAAKITGIPVARIIKLAREIGQTKPAFICQGWGPQRHSNGEQTARAIAMLAILTGNVGINGGNTGDREGTYDMEPEWFSMLKNPVKTKISVFTWPDAIERGTEMTALRDGVQGKDKLDVPIKFMWCYASNTLINQNSNIGRTHDILQDDSKCEMIVGIDHFMTASMKYCDIVLPDLMPTEQEDLIPHEAAGNIAYVILGQPATSRKFERRPIYEILADVAKRLGDDVYQTFTEGRTQHEWVRYLCEQTKTRNPDMPSYEEMKTVGIYKRKCPDEHVVAFKDFRQDPEANPLKTPSGKIEIYSEQLANIANTWELAEDDVIHPLPVFAAGFNSVADPKKAQYPFQLVGFHYKARTHSSYGNIDVLQAANPQEVWINPIDAKQKNIQDGELVRVFNEIGETRLPAKITPRIMPGVLGMGQGAWHQANMFGDRVDHGGCVNTISTHRPSPLAKGNPQHSNLVQIEKA